MKQGQCTTLIGADDAIPQRTGPKSARFVQLGRLETCSEPEEMIGRGIGGTGLQNAATDKGTGKTNPMSRRSVSNISTPNAEMVTGVPVSTSVLCAVAQKALIPVKNVTNSPASTDFVLPEFLVLKYWEQMLPKFYQPE